MTKPLSAMSLAELEVELAAVQAALAWRRSQREARVKG